MQPGGLQGASQQAHDRRLACRLWLMKLRPFRLGVALVDTVTRPACKFGLRMYISSAWMECFEAPT